MSWALANTNTIGAENLSAGTTISATLPNAVTPGNLIVVGVVQYNALSDVLTISDNKSNTYAIAGSKSSLVTVGVAAVYYSVVAPSQGGSGFAVTFACTTAGSFLDVFVGEFSFTPGATISTEGGTTGNSAGSSLVDTGSIVPTASDLLIGVHGRNSSASTHTINNGFTVPAAWEVHTSPGQNGAMAYLLNQASGVNCTWTTTNTPWVAAGVAFKATGAAATAGGAALMMGM